MAEALTPEGRILLDPEAHPLVVFAMSMGHPGDVRRILAEEEAAASALIGALPCPGFHGGPAEGLGDGPCPACGAVL